MNFNSEIPKVMHIDINSCFATIEQQANPFLRGHPIAVAAFESPKGTILAASIEAKRLGIKTGMRVFEGKQIYPSLKVLTPDPNKYRFVHLKLKKILEDYSSDVTPKSIDEFVLNFKNYMYTYKTTSLRMVAQEIKQRIKKEIGEWITVSIGISTNRYLAKIAAGLKKPDGLEEINKNNFLKVYSRLKLTDLTGIKAANAARLNCYGIYSVLDFYNAPIWKLKAAFHSITGLYWHLRLSGYEVDDVEFVRKSYGNSVAIGRSLSKIEDLSPILARLTEKMCSRFREAGYTAGGVHLMLVYKNGSMWHKGKKLPMHLFDSRDVYKAAFKLLIEAKPNSDVLNLAVSVFDLKKDVALQKGLFENIEANKNLSHSQDAINKRWGDFTVGSARSFGGAKIVMDRIAFGGVKELMEV